MCGHLTTIGLMEHDVLSRGISSCRINLPLVVKSTKRDDDDEEGKLYA